MEDDNEFTSIYDELKKESLKDQKIELNIGELEKKANVLEGEEGKNMETIKEFLEDNEFEENLNNFILAYNRENIINSEFYQKNIGLNYFKDFISFRKIKFKFIKDLGESHKFSNNFNSKNLINNSNNKIIYFVDDVKISLENKILNELILQVKYNKTNSGKIFNKDYEKIGKEMQKLDYKSNINIQFKENINNFLNLLIITEIEIKKEFDNYYKILMDNENMKKISDQICSDMKKYSFFKNNEVKISLDIGHESTLKIINVLNSIFKCNIKLIDLKSENYRNYLSKINIKIDDLLCKIIKEKSKIKYIKDIYFTEDGIFSSNNILPVIQYNFQKYFNEKYTINKDIDISALNYDPNSKDDSNFYNKIFSLLDAILNSFKNLFKKEITKIDLIIYSLINNCKCKAIYSSVFNQIYSFDILDNRNIASGKLIKVFNI